MWQRIEIAAREALMLTLLNFMTLILATCLAAAAAVALNWLLLHTALRLMRPATARQVTVRHEVVRGTGRLARGLAPRGTAWCGGGPFVQGSVSGAGFGHGGFKAR